MRLLIVDDNESIHQDFLKVLGAPEKDRLREVEMELFGDDPQFNVNQPVFEYQIDHAYQGEEAVRKAEAAALEKQPYSVIFMDVRMPPGMDGIRATAVISRKLPDTEFVICTAHSDYGWSDMLGEIGINDKVQFIRKPFDMITVQQLALSLSKKWELGQQTRASIAQLQIEIQEKEAAQKKLSEWNDALETRIRERTAELEQANGGLRIALENLKQAQEQLVASEKMASLGGLVAGVAHEINTPVGIGVTAASHLAQKTREVLLAYDAKSLKKSDLDNYFKISDEATTMILSNLNRASELIHSFKQVAVDQSSERIRRFKVMDYINEILLSLRPTIKKTNHTVEVEGDVNLEIDSFPGAFSQIFSNLTMNALIHAYEEGQSGHLKVKVEASDGGVVVSFCDDGIGIPPENLKKIFDPFFTTKRGQGGSGLGLHIVYNITTQTLGGSILCQSEVGKGTTFQLHIPYERPKGGKYGV